MNKRMLRHRENIAAVLRRDDTIAPHARDGASQEHEKGNTAIIHRSRRSFRDIDTAREDIRKTYPGSRVGRTLPNPRFWSFEVVLPSGVAPPVIEQPTTARKVPPGPSKEEGQVWCASCACMAPVKNGRYQPHKAKGSTLNCRGSNRLLSK